MWKIGDRVRPKEGLPHYGDFCVISGLWTKDSYCREYFVVDRWFREDELIAVEEAPTYKPGRTLTAQEARDGYGKKVMVRPDIDLHTLREHYRGKVVTIDQESSDYPWVKLDNEVQEAFLYWQLCWPEEVTESSQAIETDDSGEDWEDDDDECMYWESGEEIAVSDEMLQLDTINTQAIAEKVAEDMCKLMAKQDLYKTDTYNYYKNQPLHEKLTNLGKNFMNHLVMTLDYFVEQTTKNIFLSKEDMVLRENGMEDENGKPTEETLEAMTKELAEQLWSEKRADIAKKLLSNK